jgi:hypothetical protein
VLSAIDQALEPALAAEKAAGMERAINFAEVAARRDEGPSV